jgi:GT2 family glycosyltransferase
MRSHIEAALLAGRIQEARSWMHRWLLTAPSIRTQHSPLGRSQLRDIDLWMSLANVVERTSDQYLLELFWQAMDQVCPGPIQPGAALSLLGVPVLNRPDLLLNLLNSLDHPVKTLAIVDNSVGSSAERDVATALGELQQAGHPLIDTIAVARGFGNSGVAASWNQMLRAFPNASVALMVNNDVHFSPRVISAALANIQADKAQFVPLLPSPQEFSAFLITPLCWNRIGLFDESFHPAYCEDLDYRDRLRADASVEWLTLPDVQQAMAACNQEHSATIASDPELAERNRCSFAMNRLWWLSHRRLRHDPRGTWLRQWLTEWKD